MKTKEEIKTLLMKVITNPEVDENHLILFDEMRVIGYKVVCKEIKKSFHAIPIDVEDMQSVIYLIYVDTIRWFRMTNESLDKFVYYFIYKLRHAVINECRSFTSNGHTTLNFASNEDFEQVPNDMDIEREILKRLWLSDIISKLNGIQKQIVKFKIQGYSNHDISKIFNRPTNTIYYEWRKFIKAITI